MAEPLPSLTADGRGTQCWLRADIDALPIMESETKPEREKGMPFGGARHIPCVRP